MDKYLFIRKINPSLYMQKTLKNANAASVTQEQLVAVQRQDQDKKLLCFIWIPSQVLNRVLMIPAHSCLTW